MGVLAATWLGVVGGRHSLWWAAPLAGLAMAGRRSRVILIAAGACLAGLLAGFLSGEREQQVLAAAVPEGPIRVVVRATMDPAPGEFGDIWFLARPLALVGESVEPWQGPPVLVSSDDAAGLTAGKLALAEGTLSARVGWARGNPYAGRLRASELAIIDGATPTLVELANGIRQRIVGGLDLTDPAQALLAGFLVGATDDLSPVDYDALRRAGLAHFVAVSGSNVALFLTLWWLLLGPLSLGRLRGVAGLCGLLLFVVITRWEPSVVRAGVMAGIVLVGRIAGWPLDSWTALGASGALILAISPELATDVGFQLSVLATAGILAAPRQSPARLPRWLGAPLLATLFAQLAVLPLLLAVFGSVPLLAPLTNLLAAPLVAGATALGGVGTLAGFAPLVRGGAVLAATVLGLARIAAGWPQLGPATALAVVAGGWAGRVPRWRPWAVMAGAIMISFPLLTASSPPRLAVVFLDVGQGDAALLLGARGEAILVDGGPDPVLLKAALERYGVADLALVVVTHAHDDHTRGLTVLPGRYPVERLWYPGPPHTGPAWEEVVAAAAAAGIPVEVPAVGWSEVIDGIHLQVAGPLRRYDGINDQSIVLWVDAGSTRVLLTGDVERTAQADLGPLPADVLKVPHHGGATSDLKWLQATRPRLAVVSVGDNDYGHPSPEVLAALDETLIARTDVVGDVVVPLWGDPFSRLPVASAGRSP